MTYMIPTCTLAITILIFENETGQLHFSVTIRPDLQHFNLDVNT